MLNKITAFTVVILLFGFVSLQAQDQRISHQTLPDVALTGDETPDVSNLDVVRLNSSLNFGPVNSGSFTWDVHNIMTLAGIGPTGYDLQSNASTQQIWADLNNPGYLHVVFMMSEVTGFTDRTSMYVGSVDNGVTWFALGGVPTNTGTEGRNGYCVISGTSTGAAVIMNHPQYDPNNMPRSMIHIDSGPFAFDFTPYEPLLGPGMDNRPIWPRMVVDGNDNVIFASSQSANYGTADSMYTNRFDFATSLFDGWEVWSGDQAESYPFGISDGGTIGQTFLGEDVDLPNSGDVFYRESTDGGVTWGASTKIYERDHSNDTTWGAMRGLTLNYYGEEPCISFETAWQDFVGGTYRQGDANSLYFWSPTINGGDPKVLLDSSWALWNPGGGANDVYLGVSRPNLGRSAIGDYLLLVFSGASANTDPTNEDSPFFDGYIMVSDDGGDTWTEPEKFTPDGPPLVDWRHSSIPQILPTNPLDDSIIDVHISVQGDIVAGTSVQGVSTSFTAEYYHFFTQIVIVSAGEDPVIVNEFNLEQNYPNPFNPGTQINYALAERSNVTIKVYDVLGNEIATLVNTTQEAGAYDVSFDASQLSSGLYIYTLNAGNFTSSKKMMLLK